MKELRCISGQCPKEGSQKNGKSEKWEEKKRKVSNFKNTN
jgi:hypothetical protein